MIPERIEDWLPLVPAYSNAIRAALFRTVVAGLRTSWSAVLMVWDSIQVDDQVDEKVVTIETWEPLDSGHSNNPPS